MTCCFLDASLWVQRYTLWVNGLTSVKRFGFMKIDCRLIVLQPKRHKKKLFFLQSSWAVARWGFFFFFGMVNGSVREIHANLLGDILYIYHILWHDQTVVKSEHSYIHVGTHSKYWLNTTLLTCLRLFFVVFMLTFLKDSFEFNIVMINLDIPRYEGCRMLLIAKVRIFILFSTTTLKSLISLLIL